MRFLVFIFSLGGLLDSLLWILLIRPYCRKNGKGYTPGANIAATFWVDWQEAGEIAKIQNNRKILAACRVVLAVNIMWATGFLVAVYIGANAGGS